jgi:hypothetical protein
VYPLRQSPKRRQAGGLLAIKRKSADGVQALDAEPWSDLAQAVVETEFAAADTLGDERQRSRQLAGALRYVDYLTEATDEADLSESLVQAFAVWYDVDARVYRRNLTGDFALETWLPGVRPDPASMVIASHVLGSETDLRRLASSGDLGEAGAVHDALVVPLAVGRGAEWVMVLIGSVPSDADVVVRLVARVAGSRFSWFAERRAEHARRHFETLLGDTTKAPELIAMRGVLSLAQSVKASSASLALTRNGHTRRIAAVGQGSSDGVPPVTASHVFSADRLVCSLPLGGSDGAVLDLRAASGHEFSADAAIVTEACAAVLRTWLAGTLASLDASSAMLDGTAATTPAFAARIQEELERARRFDLRLSLILINVTAPSDAVAKLQDALRRELRGSDVTGAMGTHQVAALLTHTDALGLDNVVRRLKQRLADAAERLNVSDLRLGQAACSPDVRTADALLALALRQTERVTVH